MEQRTARNHFVSRGYLKGWSADGQKVWTYRVLVSHNSVRPWRKGSISGIGYHEHLYTRLAAGAESDEIERWLSAEFEAPAHDALERVRSGERLSASHWKSLVRFLAAQHVRTPARLSETLKRWHNDLPKTIDESLRSSVEKLEEIRRSGQTVGERTEDPEPLPSRVRIERYDRGGGEVRLEVVAGRGLWLFAIRHLLTKTLRALHAHKWTILHAPEGFEWITCDDPVIPLNYYGPGNYDFKGGWGSKGTEIFLPISPRHLLYTKVGDRRSRCVVLETSMAEQFQRFIAERAHRMVFAFRPTTKIEALRPRVVDAREFGREALAWKEWHEAQRRAEFDLTRET